MLVETCVELEAREHPAVFVHVVGVFALSVLRRRDLLVELVWLFFHALVAPLYERYSADQCLAPAFEPFRKRPQRLPHIAVAQRALRRIVVVDGHFRSPDVPRLNGGFLSLDAARGVVRPTFCLLN